MRLMTRFATPAWPLLLLAASAHSTANEPASTCYGSSENGRLEHGWQLPNAGENFVSYSRLGSVLGRNYVHSEVHNVMLAAYTELAKTQPTLRYVYGETGKVEGGEFSPHKTHRNGLSVDFMVPVRNDAGESVALPTYPWNKYGYDIEFDQNGRYDDLVIDFEAMALHLLALKRAADQRGVGIRRVIFDNALQQRLFASDSGKALKSALTFSIKKPWVRHDEHYHVDFIVPCKPLP